MKRFLSALRPLDVLLLLILPMLLAGCAEEEARPPSPEQLAQREAAFRQACAANEIRIGAEESLETIQATVEMLDPADPVAGISRQASLAALDFSQAYYRHAELRNGAYAHLDSVLNHSASSADSTRYLGRANSFTIRAPQPESVEANVYQSYQNNLVEILSDEDHRCNWDTPF